MDPLEMAFSVGCSPQHAFAVWTSKTALWWPRDHTISGEQSASITFEPRSGGRIFERTGEGVEYDWGEVVLWQPPHRLEYLWHIGADRSQATRVEIAFQPDAADGTSVTIVHSGWEALADPAASREGNRGGWAGVLPVYERACRELAG